MLPLSLSKDPDLDTTHLWHMRLGHMSERGLHVLSKACFVAKIGKLDFCKYCVFDKQHRVFFGIGIHKTKSTLDYIHSDI